MIDTNVFVAAGFNARSASARVLAGVRDGRLLLIWNKRTRSETEMILRRIPRLNWESFADLFRPDGEFTGPVYPDAFTLITDPDDRKFAALSAAAKSPLVTNDSDILDQRNFIEIEVFTPSEFLLQWEKSLSKRVVAGNFGDPQ